MKIDVHFSPSSIDELSLKEKVCIVIDVLRATSSIATAFSNGAKEVFPVNTVAEAGKIASNTFGGIVLAGEKNGVIIEGFHLGNSPSEYTEEKVKNKTVVFTSTNGSNAILKTRFAKISLLASFLNIGKVSNFLVEKNSDFTIICAGKNNLFCVEDTVCAGMIISFISETIDVELTDSAVAALVLYKNFGHNILDTLKNCEHGNFLCEIGFENDLTVCSSCDLLSVIPIYSNNSIKNFERKDNL